MIRLSASWADPELIPVRMTNCGTDSAVVVKGAIGSSVGGSLTGFTVSWKAAVAVVPPPDSVISVIMVSPKAFGAGVRRTVQLEPFPARKMFASGKSSRLEEWAARFGVG